MHCNYRIFWNYISLYAILIIIIIITWIYIAPFMRPKVALQGRRGVETNIAKTKDKTTNRFGGKGLGRQMGLEGPCEGVKRGDVADLRRERVPEGWG